MKLLQIASALVVAALSATSVSASPLDSDVLAYPAGVQRSVEAREVERLVARDNTAPTSPLTNYQQYQFPAQLSQAAYCGQPVGAKVGDGCVIDREFGTVDVFMIMPVKEIGARYINYYGGESPKLVA